MNTVHHVRLQDVVEGAFESRVRSGREEDQRHDQNGGVEDLFVFIRLAVEAFFGAEGDEGEIGILEYMAG
jgi:hypothetical protein